MSGKMGSRVGGTHLVRVRHLPKRVLLPHHLHLRIRIHARTQNEINADARVRTRARNA